MHHSPAKVSAADTFLTDHWFISLNAGAYGGFIGRRLQKLDLNARLPVRHHTHANWHLTTIVSSQRVALDIISEAQYSEERL